MARVVYDIVVGVDPDVDANGYAEFSVRDAFVQCEQLSLGDLLKRLLERKETWSALKWVVVVEGGWLQQGNWHINKYMTVNKAGEIGRSAGRNHQRGMDIVELCKAYDIPVEIIRPLKKVWATKDKKISHEQLVGMIACSGLKTNIRGRSSQDTRDATLIALEYSGVPLKVKPISISINNGKSSTRRR